MAFLVCSTSSLVGTNTNPRTDETPLLLLGLEWSNLFIRGRPYAVVLPEPVLALTSRSFPSSDKGIDLDCEIKMTMNKTIRKWSGEEEGS